MALVGIVVIAVVAWLAVGRDHGVDPGIAADDTGVVHVHGLGINPKDGALFAATHTGLFRIPNEGKAVRVADRWQDTMGFTIAGPDRFLGSGHPDLREMRGRRLPPLLGLIESVDAGKSWHALSLSGIADFHVLRAAHGRIYGYDSTGGALMVSIDGKTWDTRAKLSMQDFTVSPADSDMVLATTPAGVQRSQDGGRTWQSVNAPPLALLAWGMTGALWGVTSSGALFHSADEGMSWQAQGTLNGRPAAFTNVSGVLYAAIHEDGIYRSDDGGRNWLLRYRDTDWPIPGVQR